MAFSFRNLFKKDGEGTEALVASLSAPANGRGGGGAAESDPMATHPEATQPPMPENHMNVPTDPNPMAVTTDVPSGPPAPGVPSPFSVEDAPTPAQPTAPPPGQGGVPNPFEVAEPVAPTAPARQEIPPSNQPPTQVPGPPAVDARMEELENKGFRPLSSLPGGQVPDATPEGGVQPLPNGPSTPGATPARVPAGEPPSPFTVDSASPPAQEQLQPPQPQPETPQPETPLGTASANPFEVAASPQAAPAPVPQEVAPAPPAANIPSPFELPPAPTPAPLEAETPAVSEPAEGSPFDLSLGKGLAPPQPQAMPPLPEAGDAPQPVLPNNPFAADSVGPAVESAPNPAVDPVPTPPALQQPPEPQAAAPVEEPAFPTPPATDGTIDLGLREVLGPVPAETLGFDASKIPDDVMVTLPLSLIAPQLAGGSAQVTMADISNGCLEKFRPAFAKADPNTPIALPIESVLRNLPAEPEAVAPVPEQPSNPLDALEPESPPNPFESPATEPVSNPFEAAAAAPELDPPVTESPPPVPANEAPAPQPDQEGPGGASPFAALPPLGGVAPEPESAPAPEPPPPSPFGTESGGAAPESPFLNEPEPESAPAPEAAPPANSWNAQDLGVSDPAPETGAIAEPLQPSEAAPPAAESLQSFDSLPTVEASAPAPGEMESAPGFEDAKFGDGDAGQMPLRALLSTEEKLDAAAVVAHCESLPGIDACVLLSSHGEVKAVGAGKFSDAPGATLEHVRGLADNLEIKDVGSLTVRTNSGMATFFKAPPIYLGVRHGNDGFHPGVQEKLTLVSEELAKMAG